MRVWIAIWVGSSLICRYIAAWIAGGVVLRLVVVALTAGFVKGLPWTTNIVIALAVAWIGAAIVLGLREPAPAAEAPPEADPTADEQPDAPKPAPAAEPTRDELAELLHRLLGPSGGVHLKALAMVLPGPRRATREVRALLAREGIRVRPGVRGPDGAVREGVHRDDIPPLSSPADETAPAPVVAAGQGNNNNANNPFETVPDEENPQRTHVRWSAKPRGNRPGPIPTNTERITP